MLLISLSSHANHIAGGELQYKYLGPAGPNTDRYFLTMRLFRECSSPGPQLINEVVNVGAYSASTFSIHANVVLNIVGGGFTVIQLQENAIPCLVGSPDVCYQVATYTGTIDLVRLPEGYLLAWARCCRANGLINAGGQIGATYVARIPGTNVLPDGINNSPEFVVKDTALVCGDNDFVLDFGAYDVDGDSLSYEFCDAFLGGTTGNQLQPPPPSLSLVPIPYSKYSGSQPLGPGVSISSSTGIISGIAPKEPGRYVVSVCVTEWRDGMPISQHRKDFILKVGDCNITAAKLEDQYINCENFTISLQNQNNSSEIKSYFWDFGIPGMTTDTSNVAQPTFVYPDTGVYRVSLIINRNEQCSDTATAFVRIFPGFTPKFTIKGSCYINPFQFNDASTASYGVINSWKWDFGVPGTMADTSRLKNPTYQYTQMGPKEILLIVGSSKGCVGIFKDTAIVTDKPFLQPGFTDTLICSNDSLMLHAEGAGIFSWTGINIINSNSPNPVVFPKDTAYYIVELNENSCIAKDTVVVNVLDSVSVELGADTAICRTDSMRMRTVSHGLSYSWTPSEGLTDPIGKHPYVAPYATTTYHVVSRLGKCYDTDSVTIRVSPYPQSSVGVDTAICFGEKMQLNGFVKSTKFTWSPTNNMLNASTLSPVIAPPKTTTYVLTATGFEECPKSVSDTITVTVRPAVKAFAGNDTSVTVSEPLLLNASGGDNYSWSPALYLSDADISNPTATFNSNIDSIRYRVTVTTDDGCKGTDDITVVIYKTGPQIFVPDAFTPNKDNKNDLFYPVITGMKSLEFFRVYNRFGQLIFTTREVNKGWDGTLGGKDQPPGTYVYTAQAVNYKGEVVSKKGVVVLIR